uniref:Immunoglobulin V-set domain-containing protein n=1 Tax=Astatotilapia calliptera TaxID=8154 RepID=A0A3P8P8N4_ASTCA
MKFPLVGLIKVYQNLFQIQMKRVHLYDLSKNSSKILTVRNNTFSSNKHRYLFPSNGTFRINNLSRSDSGNYTLQTFDSDGRSSGERTLQLFIQGKCFPVGKLSH